MTDEQAFELRTSIGEGKNPDLMAWEVSPGHRTMILGRGQCEQEGSRGFVD